LGLYQIPENEGASTAVGAYDDPVLPARDDGAPEHDALPPLRIQGSGIPEKWWEEGQKVDLGPEPMRQPAPSERPADAGFNAFLGGAWLKGSHLSGVDPINRLKEAGKTYRAAVEGVLEILKAREQFKEALRIEKTQINKDGNNPLKFSVDTEQALLTMIGGDRPGFIPAREAMREALKDIKAHEMALVAAIQVALTRLLEQIAPETLKQRLEKSWVDGLVPGARKARIWEIYEATHAELARELADDFDRAFGKAFAEAYEEYLRAK
jgi:type VI secretion system protein ImpI/type VI secretion system protein